MIEFTVIHDTLLGPEFPYSTLNNFSFINITTERIDMFKDKITIIIHKETSDVPQEEIYSTIFQLGKLVGQTMYMK